METGPLQPGERCFLIFLDQQKGCLIGWVLKMIQLNQATLIVVTPRWQTQSW